MKIITLATATVVNTHPTRKMDGELRYPSEGSLTVSDDEAKRLEDNNLLDGEPEEIVDEDESEPDRDADLVGKKPAELKVIALKEGAPLNDATKADEMIAAIVAHRSKEA